MTATAAVRRAAKLAVREVTDRGWFGRTALDRHVVICGFPRAGSTLLELMVACCVEDTWTWPEEVPALTAAEDAHRNHRFVCTKYPRDISRVEEIRDWYRRRTGAPHFVVTVRDPRAVLSSVHAGYPASRGYYCEPHRWREVWQALQRVHGDVDVTIVRFEDLVTDPDAVEARLRAAIGWNVVTPFRDYLSELPRRRPRLDAMTLGALGGLRPPDPSALTRWREPCHVERLAAVAAQLPELPEALAALGYGGVSAWPR